MKFGALGLLLLVFSGTLAAGDYRIGVMPSSKHWDSSKDYNERHEGVFLELRLNRRDWLGGMNYENSSDRTSNLWYFQRELPINEYVSWGFTVGGVTGYKPNRPMLFSSFVLSIHFGHVGVRAQIIPLIVNGYQAYVEF